MYGQGGSDTMKGGDGDDLLDGGPGNEGMWPSEGDDLMYGGPGVDAMHGGFDEDVIYGGAGDDNPLYGGDDEDVIYGGHGDDYILSFEFYTTARDTVTCGEGKDYVEAGPEDTIAPDCERVRLIYWWMLL